MILIEHDAAGRPLNVMTVWPPEMPDALSARGRDHIIAQAPDCGVWRCHVQDGALVERPVCPATVTVAGRSIGIAELPSGSRVTVEIEGETVEVDDTTIEIDEPGPLTVVVAPPWPFLEARHAIDIE